MIVADTSALLAFFNPREAAHDSVRRVVEAETEPMVVSPYAVAELDYLVATRLGVQAELVMLNELGSGAYELAALAAGELQTAAAVVRRYADQEIGVTDASLVVLAERYRTRRVLTLDRRHFDALRPLQQGRFQLLP